MGRLLAVVAGVAVQVWLGWWALALLGFGYGVWARSQPWSALTFGVGVGLAGAAWLGWLAWRGHPIGEVHRILTELVPLPVLTLSILLPALVAFTAAYLGAALGRRMLFG